MHDQCTKSYYVIFYYMYVEGVPCGQAQLTTWVLHLQIKIELSWGITELHNEKQLFPLVWTAGFNVVSV